MQHLYINFGVILGMDLPTFLAATLYGLVGLLLLGCCLHIYVRTLYERRKGAAQLRKLEWEVKAAEIKYNQVLDASLSWGGFRKMKVVRKEKECEGVFSFYLEGHDGRNLPGFKAGQYLTFKMKIPGVSPDPVRCYSLSDCARTANGKPNHYRVTIKKQINKDGSFGVVSSYFCEKVQEGDILDVQAPRGPFVLDEKDNPVVLLAGGVGVTPMLSMLNELLTTGTNRKIWFFYGLKNSREHIQRGYLTPASVKNSNVAIHVCYSDPLPDDKVGVDYVRKGRVTAEYIREQLPSEAWLQADFYLCGPGPFMEGITTGLEQLGIPDKRVKFEAFGPATVKKKATTTERGAPAPVIEIFFSRSNKTCRWDPDSGNLLSFAEANKIAIESGCRSGSCGSCKVAIKEGEVEYTGGHDPKEAKICWTCIGQPKTNLVLDA